MKNPTVEIGVQLTDVLTQSLCSDIIVEIVKFIIYQKQLIPFPLDHLKLCISRSKSIEGSSSDQSPSIGSPRGSSFLAEKHLKKTVDSLDLLDSMFKSIISEIESCAANDLKEVLLVLGATILSPQNVFRIKIPRIEKAHSDKHHPPRKQLFNLLRSLVGTSTFADLMCQEINSKNLFIFLKLNSSYAVKSSHLLPKDNFNLPTRAQESIINIITASSNVPQCCCSSAGVFNDSNLEGLFSDSDLETTSTASESSNPQIMDVGEVTEDPTSWYQFKAPFVGFKDEKVNGKYAWTHGITPRKTDVVKNSDGSLTVHDREVRVSFTFRRLRRDGPCTCRWPHFCDSQSSKKTSPQIDSLTGENATKLETIYVHQVYDEIASHFSSTRHKPWPNVLNFVMSLKTSDILLDVGCGNGKYFGYNKSIIEVGCDRSSNLINICLGRGFQVFQCDCLSLPLRSCIVDACISIAVIHHLSSQERRKQAISEIIRVLKPGGKALIYVWAKNQNKQEMSSYLKQDRKNRKKSELEASSTSQNKVISLTENNMLHSGAVSNCYNVEDEFKKLDVSLPVHSNRTNFQFSDLLVPWILKHGESKNADSVPTFLRFYHVFEEGELENLCLSVDNCKLEKSFYDQGNWCVILEKG